MTGSAILPGEPERARSEERFVRQGFWRKVQRTLGRVPFLEDAVAAYFCALDPRTPTRVKAVLLGALAYFILPTDLIPDFIAGLGFTDDAGVLMAALAAVGGHIKGRHRARARVVLARPEPTPDDD